MYCPPHGILCLLFRGTVLGLEVQCLKVLGLRLRAHAVVVPGEVQVMVNMTMNLVGWLCFSVPQLWQTTFPPCGVHFPQMGHGMFGVFSNTFPGQNEPTLVSFVVY
jgi:hypothetical protein